MAIPWSSFFAEIEQNIFAAWPEIVPASGGGGLYELNEIERMSQKRVPAFPYAVFAVSAVESADWGLTNSAFEVKLEVHYLMRQPAGLSGLSGLATVRTKLDLLRARFLHAGNVTYATPLECEMLDWTGQHPALAVFYDKNIPWDAGGVVTRFVIGEQIT